jgi:hypothetical protein
VVHFVLCLFPFRSFLTGFKKRKDERRKKGREHLEQQFKEEKKRIRQKVIYGMSVLPQGPARTRDPYCH